MSDTLNLSMVSAASVPLAPRIANVKPFGSMILVENLTEQELTSSVITLSGKQNGYSAGTNQAYILALGSSVPEDCGLHVGQRVLLQGSFNPVPTPETARRGRGVVEIHMIKAILEEESKITCCKAGTTASAGCQQLIH